MDIRPCGPFIHKLSFFNTAGLLGIKLNKLTSSTTRPQAGANPELSVQSTAGNRKNSGHLNGMIRLVRLV